MLETDRERKQSSGGLGDPGRGPDVCFLLAGGRLQPGAVHSLTALGLCPVRFRPKQARSIKTRTKMYDTDLRPKLRSGKESVMYCPDCGEPTDECRCDLESEAARELMFDEDNLEAIDEADY